MYVHDDTRATTQAKQVSVEATAAAAVFCCCCVLYNNTKPINDDVMYVIFKMLSYVVRGGLRLLAFFLIRPLTLRGTIVNRTKYCE